MTFGADNGGARPVPSEEFEKSSAGVYFHCQSPQPLTVFTIVMGLRSKCLGTKWLFIKILDSMRIRNLSMPGVKELKGTLTKIMLSQAG